MKPTLARFGCVAAALILMSCAHRENNTPGAPGVPCDGCSSVYSEGGRLAVAQLGAADPSAVQRVADSYCEKRRLGSPRIAQSPDVKTYPQWALYDFKCADRPADAAEMKGAPAAVLAQQAPTQAPVLSPMPGQPPSGQAPMGDDAEKFGAMCVSMAFQKGTPEYSDCISKLKGMNEAQSQQLRQQQRRQAIKMIEQGLGALSPAGSSTPATIRLPSGEVLTCTQSGTQVNCN